MDDQNYKQLEQQFSSAGLVLSPAEAHGLLCGLVGTGAPTAEQRWLDELLEDTDPADLLVQECRQGLQVLFDATCAALDEPGLGVHPLLPDDAEPLAVRARALGEWCQGYLYGFGLSGAGEENLSAESREALRDLGQIAAVTPRHHGAGEEDEEALLELSEFVWVAFMLISHDLLPEPGERS